MASYQYNPQTSPAPLDMHLPEDEELLTYLEEFSPPSLDYTPPNHHAAARAAAMAAGDPYSQTGYGNLAMDRGQNASAPGSHYNGRSNYRDSMMPPMPSLHHAMNNINGRSTPYVASSSARAVPGSADAAGMPPPPYSYDNMDDHQQDMKYAQYKRLPSSITAATRTTPYPSSIHSASTTASSAGNTLYSPTVPTRTITRIFNTLLAALRVWTLTDGHEEEDVDPNHMLKQYGGNQLTFTESETPTLFELLKPYVPSSEQAMEEFAAFQALLGWFMGGGSGGITHYALWKPSARGMQFALPRLINMPKTDLGVHPVSIKLRRSILLVSSMQYRCHFCAAQVAGMGDVFHGSYRSQVREKVGSSTVTRDSNISTAYGPHSRAASNSKYRGPSFDGPHPGVAVRGAGNTPSSFKPVTDPSDPRNTQREADALSLVTAASRIPSKVTPELKRNVINKFGLEGLQAIACISAMVGWTNAITDSVGMQLGVNDILFATEQIGPNGWVGDRHAPESFTESGRFTAAEIESAKAAEIVPKKGVKRIGDYNAILKKLVIVEKECGTWTKSIPTTHKGIDDFLAQHMGFTPKYVSKDEPDPAVGDEPCEWSNGAKALMFYVYTTSTGNLLLRGHASYLAIRRKVPIHILVSAAAGVPVQIPRLDAVLDFIRSAASLKRVFTASGNIRLLENMITPRGVMEAISSLGLFNMLHRLSAMIAPEPVQFEPLVKDFLESFGPSLDMDPNDAAPQSKEERKVADPLQFLY
ncbi:hypothetical protein BC829DRAFT_436354 [Chytridium lagenaria]|nr:hypothetical protein BC829DRAFT_436354 [Chytridium lagenaria]